LIDRLRTKRHLVGQALMELDRIGLIERVPNRGAMVRSYTAEAVEQLYELRERLESEAPQRIELPWDAEALAEIKAIQADHDSAVDRVGLSAIFPSQSSFSPQPLQLLQHSLPGGRDRGGLAAGAWHPIHFPGEAGLPRCRVSGEPREGRGARTRRPTGCGAAVPRPSSRFEERLCRRPRGVCLSFRTRRA
jgi:hypothetical protein